jgi:hypothetical protein
MLIFQLLEFVGITQQKVAIDFHKIKAQQAAKPAVLFMPNALKVTNEFPIL